MASHFAREKAERAKLSIDNSREFIPTIEALVSEVGLNRVNLQEAFQELYKVSIGDYGKQVKLARIKELLLNCSFTLDAIAVMVGYNGGAALSRFFKSMEGMSPGVWRRRNN